MCPYECSYSYGDKVYVPWIIHARTCVQAPACTCRRMYTHVHAYEYSKYAFLLSPSPYTVPPSSPLLYTFLLPSPPFFSLPFSSLYFHSLSLLLCLPFHTLTSFSYPSSPLFHLFTSLPLTSFSYPPSPLFPYLFLLLSFLSFLCRW